ncbi:MAG: STAS domain-containing protein [Spirochaetes bacterium]|nr:STAS domain-containing protein [Spirochaetota bacterium]
MEINTESFPQYLIIHVDGSLTNDDLQFFKNEMEIIFENNDVDFIFDFEKVSFICSSALSLLFLFMNKIKAKNHKFIICSLRDEIRRLFVITGVDRHLELYASIEESAASLI